MNCLEFRRHCLAEPISQLSEFMEHKRSCARCAEFAAHLLLTDKRIAEVLRVQVPENLASRIILRQSIYRDRARQKQRRVLAFAASVLVVISAVVVIALRSGGSVLESVAVMAHIEAEQQRLATKQPVSPEQLAEVLNAVGAQPSGDFAGLTHASVCDLSKNGGAHLVFEGTRGRVLVLLLRNETVSGPRTIRSERLEGLIVPTDNGSMAIVGEHGEPLHPFVQKVRGAITWM